MISSIIGCIYSHLGDRMTGMFIKLSPSYRGCFVKFPEILSTPRVSGWWLTYPSEKYEFVSWCQLGWWFPTEWKNVPNHQPDIYIHVRTTASWGSLFATKGFSERRLFKLGFHADLPLQKNLLLQEALGEGYWFWHMPGVDTLMSVFNNHRLVFSKTQISSWLRHIRHDVSQLNGSLGVYPTPFEEKPYDMGSVKSIYYKIFS